MLIIYKPDEGFKLDVPYSKWLVFCIGASVLITSVRWW
jgi:hypothetical protein